ncbi:hypothetical protein BVY04_03950 [bacterium M21]|nr:hypothetical protein BVY04_03950 [bacterium M21]
MKPIGIMTAVVACWFTMVVKADGVMEAERIRKSVVRIEISAQTPNYAEPWKPGRISGGNGTGFIISDNRIMTNAHVASNAIRLTVKRGGNPNGYPAKVKFIAHDCDLAILTVDDPEFFKGTTALDIGDVPKLNSSVEVYGYPLGGKRVSITRGVVSRIEFQPYSHSRIDSHLTIQVDAAINPGNSGGPAIQNGKVIGVAFQGMSGSVAQNTGYIIPTPVIGRVLQDIKDGSYDGYMELAIQHKPLKSTAFRKFLGIPDEIKNGVLVTDVMKGSCGEGLIQRNDILLTIDGYEIDVNGQIKLNGEEVQLEETVERKFFNDKVKLTILRAGKVLPIELSLSRADAFRIWAQKHDEQPRFVLFAGLLFQPVHLNTFQAHGVKNEDVKFHYSSFVSRNIYIERPELIMLSTVQTDPINVGAKRFRQNLVDEINGVKIRRLTDVASAFKKPVDAHVIRLYQQGRPIIIQADQVKEATARIAAKYAIQLDQYLGEGDK